MGFQEHILSQGDYLLRVLVAAVCGAVVGYEREARLKKAGIRTHTILSMGAALMVVISKYGFFDVVGYDSVQVDASRVAAGVVTGVGFLGGGIILNRKSSISGITTSAGIWATLGIGMAIGAGMWTLGIGSAAMLIVVQYLFHRSIHFLKEKKMGHVHLHMKKGDTTPERITASLMEMQVRVIATHLNIFEDDSIEATLDVLFPVNFDSEKLLTLMGNYPEISSVDT